MNYAYNITTINLNSTNSLVNKYLLKDFLLINDIDIAFLQEVVYENFSFVPNYTVLVNINSERTGTAILLKNNLDVKHPIIDPSGRLISIVVNKINFVNVYAYSGTNKKKQRDDLFLNQIATHITKNECSYSVIVGDFNCILDKADSNALVKNFSWGLKKLVERLNLKDVVKVIGTPQFTFFRGGSTSRLDRFYGPQAFIDQVASTKTIAVPFSDHRAVVLKVKMEHQDLNIRGRGYWKINPTLIQNDEVSDRFKHEYVRLQTRQIYEADRSSWWNFAFKSKVRNFYKGESWRANQEITRNKSELYATLHNLTDRQANGENLVEEIGVAKSKLMEVEQLRLRNYELKLQDSTLANGERLSIFHVTKQINKSYYELSRPADDTGVSIQNNLRTIHEHYSKLYATEPQEDATNLDDPLCNVANSLSDADGRVMLEPITTEEAFNTLKLCANKKSPGPDGLTYEFYMQHFDVVKDDMVMIFNSYLSGSAVPPKEFTAGIITLIPKKGNSTNLEDQRPISLLNTDYKLFTKILAGRVTKVMAKILGPGQTAAVGDRCCTDNLKDVRRIVTRAMESRSFKGFLLSVDLEKAFDKVSHCWLWKVLEKFKFTVELINCIKHLYSRATSKVLYKGFLTAEIIIGSSVRQGCPFSMLLFALYVEPLIRSISNSSCGVLVYGTFLKVIAYADDLNIFLRNQEEFDLVMQILSSYSRFARIKLNLTKSAFMRLNNAVSGPQLIKEVTDIKILGVIINGSWAKMVDVNYEKLVHDVKFMLQLHAVRNLNLYEKIWLLNTFVLSKLWYIAQVLPPKNKHIAQLKKTIGSFIWRGSIFKVARDQLYLDYGQGGVRLIDPESQCKALFVKNILFDKSGQSNKKEEYLMQHRRLGQLTRNGKEWIEEAIKLKRETTIDSTRRFYWHFIGEKNIQVAVECRFEEVEWEFIWQNLSYNFLLSSDKAILYKLVNDVISNKQKLQLYNIGGVFDIRCEMCAVADNNLHRIRDCLKTKHVREWVSQVLRNRINVRFEKVDDILQLKISRKSKQQCAALWITVHMIAWCISGESNSSLFCFQKSIRESKWNNRYSFDINFGQFLNCC